MRPFLSSKGPPKSPGKVEEPMEGDSLKTLSKATPIKTMLPNQVEIEGNIGWPSRKNISSWGQ